MQVVAVTVSVMVCTVAANSFSLRLLSVLLISHTSTSYSIEGSEKIGLVTFSIIGFIFFDVVYVVAVMNYAAQSELNIYLLRAIRMLVERKQYENMDMAIKVRGRAGLFTLRTCILYLVLLFL